MSSLGSAGRVEMPDVSPSLLDLFMIGPQLLPWLALPGALLTGYWCYQRTRNLYVAVGMALLGC